MYLFQTMKNCIVLKNLIKIDLQPLDKVLEGKHRKGHFDGVVRVVKYIF
jgi:pantothenate synthetase